MEDLGLFVFWSILDVAVGLQFALFDFFYPESGVVRVEKRGRRRRAAAPLVFRNLTSSFDDIIIIFNISIQTRGSHECRGYVGGAA